MKGTYLCLPVVFLGVGSPTKKKNALTGSLYYLKTASQVDSRFSECKHFSHTETHARTHTQCTQKHYLCWQAGCRACLPRASCVPCSWTRRNPGLRSRSPLAPCWCGWSPPAWSAPRTCSKHTCTNTEQAIRYAVSQTALSQPISHVRGALNGYLQTGEGNIKCTRSGFSG